MELSRGGAIAFACALAGCALFTDLGDLAGSSASLDASGLDGAIASFDSGADSAKDTSTFTCDPIEAGKACSPGEVDCFAYGACGAQQICCSSYGCVDAGLVGKCLQIDGGWFECDETADCPGKQCCYGHTSTDNRLGARCNSSCSIDPEDVTACKQDSECGDLQHCKPVTCEGVVIQSCGGKCPQ